jgi:outer membrane beta-barrel protein
MYNSIGTERSQLCEEANMPISNGHLSPYINGRFATFEKAERIFSAFSPLKPDVLLATSQWSKDCVEELVQGMKEASMPFSQAPLGKRLALISELIAILKREKNQFIEKLMLELGRSRFAVEEEWLYCEQIFAMLPDFCREALSEKTDPQGFKWSYASVGLCLLSANVSLPLYSLLASALPALAGGNAVCVRPSLHCPLSAVLLAQCVHEAKFPAGLFQLVLGDLEVYRRLVLTRQFDCVLYSGGDESLEQIRRDLSTSQKTRIVLCGGGKNASLMMADCNLEAATAQVVLGATVDCGQRIESTGLVLIEEKIFEQALDAIVTAVKALPIGVKNDLNDPRQNVMGPLCGVDSFERFLRFQGIAHRESLDTLRWGKPIDNLGNGFFVSPGVHLLDKEKMCSGVYASNAFFGPDLGIVRVNDAAEAVYLLDKMQAARVLSVHTATAQNLEPLRLHSQVPSLQWNAPTTRMNPLLPSVGRGRAGNSYATGLRFLFNTVYPRTLNMMAFAATLCALFGMILGLFSNSAQADYRKAVEGNEVVKGKFYPKSGRFELGVGGGAILNQSFINTFLVSASATYHLSDWHALSIEGFYGMSQDRGERTAVESFYRDTKRASAYGEDNPNPSKDNAKTPRNQQADDAAYPNANADAATKQDLEKHLPLERKPAYMPIRQINTMAMMNYQWTPVYGKALWFLSAVGYLDLFANFGLGVAMSDYTPLKNTIGNTGKATLEGTSEANEYGKEGRPAVQAETSPVLGLGLGSRFFFAKHFMVHVNLRNFSVIAKTGDSAFMNFFALWGGVGVMF